VKRASAFATLLLCCSCTGQQAGDKDSLRGVLHRSEDGKTTLRTLSGERVVVSPIDALGLPDGVPVKLDQVKRRNGVLEFAHAHSDLSKDAIAKSFGQLSTKSKDALAALSGEFEKYQIRIEKQKGKSSPEDRLKVEGELERARRQTAQDYVEAVRSGDKSKADEAVRSTRSIRMVEKQIYGFYDNYPPEDYRRIYENTKGGGTLAFDGLPWCSAVLIGPNLALTAAHCFKNRNPQSAEVWFNYSPEGISRGVKPACADAPVKGSDAYRVKRILSPSAERVPDMVAGRFNGELLDYALLELEPGQHGKSAGGCWPVQCLMASRELTRREPLYVVGHPQRAPQTVHDNSRVFLPFHLAAADFDALKADVAAELANHPQRDELAQQFTSSYRETKDQGGRSFWNLYDVRTEGQPRVGIEADTFGGNSGSPVYDRRSHCVAALFASGAPDFDPSHPSSEHAGWARHESALPMSAVTKDLDRQIKSWRELGVIIR
jgi:hypothetical protein